MKNRLKFVKNLCKMQIFCKKNKKGAELIRVLGRAGELIAGRRVGAGLFVGALGCQRQIFVEVGFLADGEVFVKVHGKYFVVFYRLNLL